MVSVNIFVVVDAVAMLVVVSVDVVEVRSVLVWVEWVVSNSVVVLEMRVVDDFVK